MIHYNKKNVIQKQNKASIETNEAQQNRYEHSRNNMQTKERKSYNSGHEGHVAKVGFDFIFIF